MVSRNGQKMPPVLLLTDFVLLKIPESFQEDFGREHLKEKKLFENKSQHVTNN